MHQSPPRIFMFCGKVASGKSTYARQLAQDTGAVLLVEDDWLHGLYSDQIRDIADFVRCSAALRSTLGPHVIALLAAGMSVVLDFQANTVESRIWMRQIIDAAGVAHEMHVLTPSDDLCLRRLHARNAKGDHPFTVTDEQFHRLSAYFVPPGEDEGFTIVLHDRN